MRLKNIKILLVATYGVAIAVGGALAGVSSASGWIALAALILLPAAAVLTLWKEEPPSMSESIQRARR